MITERTIEVLSDPRFTVLVVESVDFQHARIAAGGYVLGNMKPLAVIVRSRDSTVTFDMLGNPTDQTDTLCEYRKRPSTREV